MARDLSGNNRVSYQYQVQNQFQRGGTGSTDDASFYAGAALDLSQNMQKPLTPLIGSQKQMPPNQLNQFYRDAIGG